MSRRVTTTKSKKKAYEDRIQGEINMFLKDYCSHCKEPITGKDRCDICAVGQRLSDLYFMKSMNETDW